MNVNSLFRYSLIAIVATLLFVPFLGNVHLFDWDEINFAECAREMISTGDYLRPQIDFQPFWEKPPLFIWMQVLSMKAFGVTEFAARFPNAIVGVLTLLSIYYVGRKVMHERLAMWWTILYAASWLPHFYFKSGIIDPWFNYFIFLAFFQVHLMRFGKDKVRHGVIAGLFLGLSVLTKGPAAALIAILALLVYVILNRGLWGYKLWHFLLIAFVTFLPFVAWFAATILVHGWQYGSWFIQEFVVYQIRLFQTEDADHGGPFFYHFIVLLVGCFPASIFLFQYRKKRVAEQENQRDFTRWMWILFWVTLLLFSIVKTKIVHYSSLCYFPLTFLAALKVDQLVSGSDYIKRSVKILFVFLGVLWSLLLFALPIVGIFKKRLIPFIDDPFAVGNLQANVSWTMWECGWGALLLVVTLIASIWMNRNFRKGFLFFCIGQIALIQVTILHFTPKIEAYSQRSAIQFFMQFQGKDVYIQPLDYKSYAHLFYARKKPSVNKNYYKEGWLLNGKVDKPTYFICKNTAANPYRKLPQLIELGERNGFVFFQRR
ncbi:MAG: glycosyltransferase family 39 protein [Bacteroidetes bacterium]|nr:glycosyltransferase family 39 protein [Bacteroidota bacterium]MBS1741239.1 glycosyltransferase family 39 protein [Bacteroidota bacterium]